MEPNIDSIRSYYQKLSDEELARIATHEADGLREDAALVLVEELGKRGLPQQVFQDMKMQMAPIDGELVAEYCNLLSSLPCPFCNSDREPLNAYKRSSQIGLFVVSLDSEHILISCSDCAKKKFRQSNLITAFLGWWSIPYGPFKTIHALYANSQEQKNLNQSKPTELFKKHVKQHIKKLYKIKAMPESLKNFIVEDV